MSDFSKVTAVYKEFEGGETGQTRSNAPYRNKANFGTPRSPRLNQRHMRCGRLIEAILIFILLIATLITTVMNGMNGGILSILSFYSIWGQTFAFLAHLSAILAMDYESWFKFAYITTEISYSVNFVIVLIFWFDLWPMMMGMIEEGTGHFAGMDNTMITVALIYSGLQHAVPFITTVFDLATTDMALEKSHWWILFLVACPFYMVFNWWGAMNLGSVRVIGEKGTIYGFERWGTNIPLTMFMFVIFGFLQAGIHWGTAALIDKIWPKRAAEEFSLKENLLDEEKNTGVN